MNDFTRVLLERALAHTKPKQPDPARLLNRITEVELFHYRDEQVEERASLIEACVSYEKLICLVDVVMDAMNDRGEWHSTEYPDTEDAPDEAARFSAFGIACLWWMKREDRGLIPPIDCTKEEIEMWLVERESPELRQLSLFDWGGA